MILFNRQDKGSFQVKKNPIFEKNSYVGGWVKRQLGFVFFGGIFVFYCVFCVVFMFSNVSKENTKLDKGVSDWV